jgi:hypothetical protein
MELVFIRLFGSLSILQMEEAVSTWVKDTHCHIRHSGRDSESSFFKVLHQWMLSYQVRERLLRFPRKATGQTGMTGMLISINRF